MKLNKRQKLFLTVTPIAAVVTICSQINISGLPTQSYSQSPDAALLTLVADNKQADTPEAIGRACLPPNEAAGAELTGEYRNPVSTQLFQVWKLQITPHHTVSRVLGIYGIGGPDGTVCLLAYDERYNDTIGDDLAEEDARQVALVIWQHTADQFGGVAALQAGFNNEAAELAQYGEKGYISAEDKWALENLGVHLPSIYVIYDPENPPQQGRSGRGEI